MRKTLTTVIAIVILTAASTYIRANQQANASALRSPAAGNPVPAPVAPAIQTEKQKAIASEAQQLFTMATDLKTQVDKTNKNILSLTVVQKAEEIEQFAHRIKEHAKKGPA